MQQTDLPDLLDNSELPARSEDKASLIRSNTKMAEKLYNTTLSQNSTQSKAQTSKWDKAPGKSSKQAETPRNRETDTHGENRYQKYAFSSPTH